MREHRITLPELALVAGTRGMIGFGAGLLIADHLRQRRGAGIALLVAGVLSTIPLAFMIFRERRRPEVETRIPHDTPQSVAEMIAD